METAHWASVGKNIMHTHALFLLDCQAGIHLFVEMLRIQAMKLRKLNTTQKSETLSGLQRGHAVSSAG